jgi:hypothetical protein
MSEETDSGSSGDEFPETMEGLLTVGVNCWRKNVLATTPVGVYFQFPEGEIPNSGDRVFHDVRCRQNHELSCRIRNVPC